MRIKIIQKPPFASVDGLDLSKFIVGQEYDLGNTVGALFLAEGWAQPADGFEPTGVTGGSAKDVPSSAPKREFFPPYYQGPDAVTGEGPPKSHRRSRDDET